MKCAKPEPPIAAAGRGGLGRGLARAGGVTRGATPRTRLSAGERREHVLAAAIAEFAVAGYHGTPTESIARAPASPSRTSSACTARRRTLFLACVERCFDRMLEHVPARRRGRRRRDERLAGDGPRVPRAARRPRAAALPAADLRGADDAEIRAAARRRYEQLADVVGELTGHDRDGVLPFIGQGMLHQHRRGAGPRPRRAGCGRGIA